MASDGPPPPPPPHGSAPRPSGGLPDGNYDIFIIPPHSAGSGFLYLPSLQVQRNSFLAGVACTLLAVGVWTLAMPVLKQWTATLVASGGVGVVLLVMGVGVAGWAFGKTQGESGGWSGSGGGGGTYAHQKGSSTPPQSGPNGYAPPPRSTGFEPPPHTNGHAPPPHGSAWGSSPPPPPPPPRSEPPPQSTPRPPPPESPPKPKPTAGAQTGWEKAREETRRREEERKRAAELQKKREEAQKLREEAEKAAKAKAEKEKWEQARAREKEQREREARERIARDRLAREKEQREKDSRDREAREKAEKEKAARSTATKSNISATYQRPTAKSAAGTEDHEAHSYRPYDRPAASSKPASRPAFKSSASSISGLSESSYAPSATTARTTPPPSQRGPYTTTDEDKIIIKAVYLFSDSFPGKPIASLLSNQGSVTDGLILRVKTEGLFIDDDVRGVPQREWDVKAWTLKLVEDGKAKVGNRMLHILRASVRDAENKRYTFVLEEGEAWKVALGLGRLKKGSQVRALGMNGLKEAEVVRLLGTLGWT
ncbi:hypothetical protein MBLNU230_g0180t1 [Neophaeotheca triangularis]